MIVKRRCLLLIVLLQTAFTSVCAQDSTENQLSNISPKYLQQVSSKMDTYYKSITSKTEKTLERLAKWEGKIKALFEKASPETVQRLFGNGQLTFADVLNKYKEGKQIADGQRARYDEYRDKLTTTVKYLDEKKAMLDSNLHKPLKNSQGKTAKLNEQIKNTEQVQLFIKERKKQLLEQTVKYVGKSKYLQKINKEAYYYAETLRNYKEIFSTPGKAEETAVKLLQKIPAFDEFLRKNSMLASLFRTSDDPSSNMASLAGLQTRAQVNGLIQQQIASGGPNAQQQFQQNVQEAQSQLSKLKDKVLKAGGSSSDAELPEGFRANQQRTKTFWQKWELGVNVQSNRANGITPVSSDLGISAGFRPHDKFITGVGLAGRIGWGKDIQHIAVSYQGLSGRFFSEYKIKGSFHAAAGFEMNYRPEIRNFDQLRDYSAWQKSCLVGVGKVVSVKSKFFKKTKLLLAWDVLSYQQVPRAQAVIFRVGYNF